MKDLNFHAYFLNFLYIITMCLIACTLSIYYREIQEPILPIFIIIEKGNGNPL